MGVVVGRPSDVVGRRRWRYKPLVSPTPHNLAVVNYLITQTIAVAMSLKDYRLLTFDVYGTLVDWESGIVSALSPVLAANNATTKFTKTEILTVYSTLEKEQQSKTPEMIYSTLLATIYPTLLNQLGLPPPTDAECATFGESIGLWPPFPDTVAALHRLRRQYKLVVLSNVDRASFAKTNAGSLQGFAFDQVITAQDVGSYKPDLRNFRFMLDAVRERFAVQSGEVLQTAQSQFHDHAPARKVGVKSVWIVRPGAAMGNVDPAEEIYDWKFDTLGEMADALEAEP
ncbi:putative haloalkanoic acid dehalogenase [Aspergillus lucknowensis]|uniref:HAD-like domain-containing protein n=1 Tax=Aspergillus lucknowensis TaxID=176173 RepID=A0ABR4LS53_9EURO